MAEYKGFLGKGLAFPVAPEPATGRLRERSGEEDIREAVGIILGTRKGERVMRPEFGCRIHEYVFGTMDYDTLRQMEGAVTEALILWEPRIEEIQVRADPDSDRDGTVLLTVAYRVRSTNNQYNLVFPFYMSEGAGGV